MEPITVERGHPLPDDHFKNRFPWADMKPGDSFTIRGNSNRNSARASFHKYSKKYLNTHNVLLILVTKQIGPDLYRLWVIEAGDKDPR